MVINRFEFQLVENDSMDCLAFQLERAMIENEHCTSIDELFNKTDGVLMVGTMVQHDHQLNEEQKNTNKPHVESSGGKDLKPTPKKKWSVCNEKQGYLEHRDRPLQITADNSGAMHKNEYGTYIRSLNYTTQKHSPLKP